MPAGVVRPNSDIEPVVGIQFGIFSPDEIERRSVVEVTNAGTYDGNEPRIGGLFDPRMGVLDNGKTCRSCGQTNHSCPGHFGHFKLARPVYFIQFFQMILDTLNCVCVRCSKLLIDKNLHKDINRRRGEVRWRSVKAACNNIGRCGQETEDGCGARQPSRYVREGIASIVAEWDAIEGADDPSFPAAAPTKQRQRLEVEYVQRLLRRLTDEDVDFMGMSRYWCRPDWMICSVMPIPPPQVRPSVIQDNNQRSEDDLTHKLVEIIMTNQRLQNTINNNADRKQIEDEHTVLQYHVATLIDNQIPGVAPSAQRSGRPLKSVQQRLGSKEGRIRYNIQGKRVEFSARSVITPDPNISIGELGVPMKIAMNLTFPEKVTPYNRDQMYRLVQNGPDTFPGAKTIMRSDGRMISLKHVNTKEIVLHIGDVVNRHLNDGDIVLFNRQPTLHRMSMMGHRVKVLPYNTFRLNVSVTAPYNADFDGDEMNLHCPQSYEAATELMEIAAVPHQIVTPRHAKPVIGIVQDTLAGSYRLTRPHVSFNRREYMNMMMWNKRFEGVVPEGKVTADTGRARYNGQQILSQLLPPINIEMGNGLYKDNKSQENLVKIREGEVLQGIFDKDIFSKPSKGIIHTIFKDYGSKDVVNFIDTMQNTVEQFLVYNGFSVGISDLIADEETRKQMEEVIKKRKTAVENILLQIHMDLFDNNTGKTNQQEFEDKVFVELNKATDEAGKIGLGALSDENRLVAMVRAGSKGSNINIAQMMACVGQQAPEGKRIPYGFTDRTLPHYKKYDDGAEARGFVESSFIEGLTPQEFFFHAMSGREGLIDTAVKTADTGYIQRQLVKAMEDLVVQYDGSVRDSRGNITQFYYGEDGINATKIESVGLGIGKLSEEEIKKSYGMADVELATILEEGTLRGEDTAALETFVDAVLADRRMLVEGIQKSKQDAPLFASVNLERVLTNVAVSFRLDPKGKTDLTPLYVLQGIERMIAKTQRYHNLWAACLRFYLAPHRLIVKERFTRRAFDAACEMILVKNYQSWVQPGEQVGIIAAQSIGEPSTQMSAHKDTLVHVQAANGEHFCGKIGEFVDRLLKERAAAVVPVPGHDDSVVLDMKGGEYSIVGVSVDEKTSWRAISQVSRHPANGGLVRVTTKSGRTTTATLSHSFLKRTEAGIAPILGSELEVGMRIPIATHVPEMEGAATTADGFALTREFGWLCGMYLADGSLNGNQIKITKIADEVEESIRAVAAGYDWEVTTKDYEGEFGPCKDTMIASKALATFLQANFSNKSIGPKVFSMCREFQLGVLGGYFDGDGNVNPDRQQIRASSRSQDLIRSINRLLGYCGFFGVLGSETSARIPGKTMYTLNILKKYAAEFEALIGFRLKEKATGLAEIVTYCARENKHDTKEIYDKIPAIGDLIAETGRALDMPGQSRNYGRWSKKESVGRLTLESYIEAFKAKAGSSGVAADLIQRLESAVAADVLWDEIVDLTYLDDPKEYVYDFTIPGNQSFMVDDMIMVHNTLNTFHLAGVASKSNVTRGVPRLKELLKVTQNPKAISLSIPLKPEFRGNKEKAREVAQDLELTLLKDITIKTAVYFDPDDGNSIIGDDQTLIDFYRMFEAEQEGTDEAVTTGEDEKPAAWSGWLLRFELDREHMFRKNISMDDVAYVLRSKFGEALHLIYSDYNSDKLIMRMRLPDLMKGGSLDDLVALKKFQTRILNGIVFRGVPGIKSVSFREDKDMLELNNETGKYEQVTQYVLDTDGSNFLAVMRHPYVDAKRLASSHVHDIFEVLGIEATRQTLLNEITTLFEEAGVNNRHLGLLCDVMTRAGRLMSADRHGINKTDIGPLAKASFEETEKILLNAALYGELDPVTGVSANIMMGQPIRGGTGFFQVLLDEGAFMRLQKGLPPAEGYDDEEEDVDEPTQEQIDQELYEDENDLCSSARLRMNVAMPKAVAMLEEPDVEIAVIDGEEEE